MENLKRHSFFNSITKKTLLLLLSLFLVLCCSCGINTDTEESSDSISEEYSETVYITKSGSKYHSDGCIHLRKSCIEIDLSEAEMKGYTPCLNCR